MLFSSAYLLTPTHPPRTAESLFGEFAEEAMTDLQLKEGTLRTREFVVQALVTCTLLLSAPSGVERDVEIKLKYAGSGLSSQPPSPAKSPPARQQFSFSFEGGPVMGVPPSSSVGVGVGGVGISLSTTALQARLRGIVTRRLAVMRKALLAVVAVAQCSESLAVRSVLLAGPPPLDLDSWLQLLTADLFELLCQRHAGDLGLGLDQPHAEAAELAFLRRSLGDVQTLLMSELAGVAGALYSRPLRVGGSRVSTYFDCAPLVVGDVFVRQRGWEASLERVLSRISSLVDDMCASERAERRGGPGGRAAGGAAGVGGLVVASVDGGAATATAAAGIALLPVSVPKSPRKKANGGWTRGFGGAARSTPTQAAAVAPAEPRTKHSPLETQEILLLKSCLLLRALAWDSAKVRECLRDDHLSLFLPIVTALNVVCPRLPPDYAAAAAAAAIADDEHHPQAQGSAARFMRCLPGASAPAARTTTTTTTTSPLVPVPDDVLFPWIPLTRYGAHSLQHIDRDAWRLVHLSRRAVEESINILGVHHLPAFQEAAALGQVRPGQPLAEIEASPRGWVPNRGGGGGGGGGARATRPAAGGPVKDTAGKPALTIVTDEDQADAPTAGEGDALLAPAPAGEEKEEQQAAGDGGGGGGGRRGRASRRDRGSPRAAANDAGPDSLRDTAPLLKRTYSPIR